jgi:uracil phosphoribosyltransferase
MTIINLAEGRTILNTFVEELRHVEVQKDPLRFRRNLERIGEILAVEISKKLSYELKETTTPLGISKSMIMNDNLVIATILRAGLPMHHGFLNIFDRAENAFVSAYRKYTDKEHFEIHVEYISAPDISGKTLVLIDPMLATGASFELALEALFTKGKPAKIFMACAIASREGLAKLSNNPAMRDVEVWCAAIDPELNAKSYIIPGLGDAGDLAFGIKE